jgi:predicted DNA-binding transcriptional regulator AlpA
MSTLSESPSARSKRSALPGATYSIADLAALTRTAYTTIWDGIHRGDLPVKPIKIGRRYMFPKAEVDRLLGLTHDETD